MKKTLKYWWMILLKGIILVILSFYVFSQPINTLIGLAFYIGISLLATGVLLIISALLTKKTDENWGWKFAEGILDTIVAFILLSNLAVTAALFPLVVGSWMMAYGIITLSGSFKQKKSGDSNWWISLVSGILAILLGYFIVVNLLAGAIAITIWIGLGFMLFGLANIFLALQLKKVNALVI